MINIHRTLSAFANLSVLIIGDVMIDQYLFGRIERISPEAPVPIISLDDNDERLGGAANVALNVAALGGTPIVCSVIGMDAPGERLMAILEDNQICKESICMSKTRKTTVKSRVIAHHQQMMRIDEEDTHDLDSYEEVMLLERVIQALKNNTIDVIIFQDYNKGVLSQKIIQEILLEAIKRDIPTVVDPKKNNFFTYNRVTLFKPNLREINDRLPFKSQATITDLKMAAKYIQQRLNNTYTLITLSADGIFIGTDNEGKIIPTTSRKISDVCGAGDTVVSMAALGIAAKLSIEDIAQLANLAGGQVCERVGVVPVKTSQLIADYEKVMKY